MGLAYSATGSGPPLVLLHAFPFSREMWQPQTALTGSRIICPDFAGFGQSAPDSNMTIDTMADDVAALLDELSIQEPIVLGGCSMGGYVALAFMRRHATRVRGLILSDTKAEADDETARANRTKMIDSAKTLTAASVIEGMIPKALSQTTQDSREAIVEEVRRIGASQPVNGIVAAQQAMRERPDSRPKLREISVPTLVIVGEADAITPPAVAQTLAEGIPNSERVTIPEAGHLPNLENPNAFNEAVQRFLDRLNSGK